MAKYIIFDTVNEKETKPFKILPGKAYKLLGDSAEYVFMDETGRRTQASKTITLWGERRIVEDPNTQDAIRCAKIMNDKYVVPEETWREAQDRMAAKVFNDATRPNPDNMDLVEEIKALDKKAKEMYSPTFEPWNGPQPQLTWSDMSR